MKVKIWLVKFGDNWSKQRVVAPNVEAAMRKARRLHLKECRENKWSKGTQREPITYVELEDEGER
jgi:hypothetical protein